MSKLDLTKRELDIMSVLWELGEVTVNEVRDRVDPNLAYTGISSMIRGRWAGCWTRFTAGRRSSSSLTSWIGIAYRTRSSRACATC